MTLEQIKSLIKWGDPQRIAERAGKSKNTVNSILSGYRAPQPWFLQHAEAFLRDQKRI